MTSSIRTAHASRAFASDASHPVNSSAPVVVQRLVRTLLILVIALFWAVGAAAQAPGPLLELPQAPRGWVAEVSITGGFTGRGRGSLAVASTGRTACVAPLGCTTSSPADAVSAVGRILTALRTSSFGDERTRQTCFDCYLTTLTIRSRTADGGTAVSVFSWTDANIAAVPEDVKAVYRAILELADQHR
jgi:hypothetical protein